VHCSSSGLRREIAVSGATCAMAASGLTWIITSTLGKLELRLHQSEFIRARHSILLHALAQAQAMASGAGDTTPAVTLGRALDAVSLVAQAHDVNELITLDALTAMLDMVRASRGVAPLCDAAAVAPCLQVAVLAALYTRFERTDSDSDTLVYLALVDVVVECLQHPHAPWCHPLVTAAAVSYLLRMAVDASHSKVVQARARAAFAAMCDTLTRVVAVWGAAAAAGSGASIPGWSLSAGGPPSPRTAPAVHLWAAVQGSHAVLMLAMAHLATLAGAPPSPAADALKLSVRLPAAAAAEDGEVGASHAQPAVVPRVLSTRSVHGAVAAFSAASAAVGRLEDAPDGPPPTTDPDGETMVERMRQRSRSHSMHGRTGSQAGATLSNVVEAVCSLWPLAGEEAVHQLRLLVPFLEAPVPHFALTHATLPLQLTDDMAAHLSTGAGLAASVSGGTDGAAAVSVKWQPATPADIIARLPLSMQLMCDVWLSLPLAAVGVDGGGVVLGDDAEADVAAGPTGDDAMDTGASELATRRSGPHIGDVGARRIATVSTGAALFALQCIATTLASAAFQQICSAWTPSHLLDRVAPSTPVLTHHGTEWVSLLVDRVLLLSVWIGDGSGPEVTSDLQAQLRAAAESMYKGKGSWLSLFGSGGGGGGGGGSATSNTPLPGAALATAPTAPGQAASVVSLLLPRLPLLQAVLVLFTAVFRSPQLRQACVAPLELLMSRVLIRSMTLPARLAIGTAVLVGSRSMQMVLSHLLRAQHLREAIAARLEAASGVPFDADALDRLPTAVQSPNIVKAVSADLHAAFPGSEVDVDTVRTLVGLYSPRGAIMSVSHAATACAVSLLEDPAALPFLATVYDGTPTAGDVLRALVQAAAALARGEAALHSTHGTVSMAGGGTAAGSRPLRMPVPRRLRVAATAVLHAMLNRLEAAAVAAESSTAPSGSGGIAWSYVDAVRGDVRMKRQVQASAKAFNAKPKRGLEALRASGAVRMPAAATAASTAAPVSAPTVSGTSASASSPAGGATHVSGSGGGGSIAAAGTTSGGSGAATAASHRYGEVAGLLHDFRHAAGFHPVAIGEFLGTGAGNEEDALRRAHVAALAEQYQGLSLVSAMRLYLRSFRLPGESQMIDRVLQGFATVAHTVCSDGAALPSIDATHLLSFSIIMLNTDQHNANIKPERKMTLDGFIRNNAYYTDEINHGRRTPEDVLRRIFDSVKGHAMAPPLTSATNTPILLPNLLAGITHEENAAATAQLVGVGEAVTREDWYSLAHAAAVAADRRESLRAGVTAVDSRQVPANADVDVAYLVAVALPEVWHAVVSHHMSAFSAAGRRVKRSVLDAHHHAASFVAAHLPAVARVEVSRAGHKHGGGGRPAAGSDVSEAAEAEPAPYDAGHEVHARVLVRCAAVASALGLQSGASAIAVHMASMACASALALSVEDAPPARAAPVHADPAVNAVSSSDSDDDAHADGSRRADAISASSAGARSQATSPHSAAVQQPAVPDVPAALERFHGDAHGRLAAVAALRIVAAAASHGHGPSVEAWQAAFDVVTRMALTGVIALDDVMAGLRPCHSPPVLPAGIPPCVAQHPLAALLRAFAHAAARAAHARRAGWATPPLGSPTGEVTQRLATSPESAPSDAGDSDRGANTNGGGGGIGSMLYGWLFGGGDVAQMGDESTPKAGTVAPIVERDAHELQELLAEQADPAHWAPAGPTEPLSAADGAAGLPYSDAESSGRDTDGGEDQWPMAVSAAVVAVLSAAVAVAHRGSPAASARVIVAAASAAGLDAAAIGLTWISAAAATDAALTAIARTSSASGSQWAARTPADDGKVFLSLMASARMKLAVPSPLPPPAPWSARSRLALALMQRTAAGVPVNSTLAWLTTTRAALEACIADATAPAATQRWYQAAMGAAQAAAVALMHAASLPPAATAAAAATLWRVANLAPAAADGPRTLCLHTLLECVASADEGRLRGALSAWASVDVWQPTSAGVIDGAARADAEVAGPAAAGEYLDVSLCLNQFQDTIGRPLLPLSAPCTALHAVAAVLLSPFLSPYAGAASPGGSSLSPSATRSGSIVEDADDRHALELTLATGARAAVQAASRCVDAVLSGGASATTLPPPLVPTMLAVLAAFARTPLALCTITVDDLSMVALDALHDFATAHCALRGLSPADKEAAHGRWLAALQHLVVCTQDPRLPVAVHAVDTVCHACVEWCAGALPVQHHNVGTAAFVHDIHAAALLPMLRALPVLPDGDQDVPPEVARRWSTALGAWSKALLHAAAVILPQADADDVYHLTTTVNEVAPWWKAALTAPASPTAAPTRMQLRESAAEVATNAIAFMVAEQERSQVPQVIAPLVTATRAALSPPATITPPHLPPPAVTGPDAAAEGDGHAAGTGV